MHGHMNVKIISFQIHACWLGNVFILILFLTPVFVSFFLNNIRTNHLYIYTSHSLHISPKPILQGLCSVF
jgi:hypothetical protein